MRRCAAWCAGRPGSCCSGAPSPCWRCRGSTIREPTARWPCSCARSCPPEPVASRRSPSAYRRRRRSTTMPAFAPARSMTASLPPARCSSSRAARSMSSTTRGRAGPSSPMSAGPATRASATASIASGSELEMNTRPLTGCAAWQKLLVHAESWRAVHLRELFAGDAARPAQLVAQAPGLRLDYSRQRLGAMTLRLLAHLAGERGFAEWREALLAGKKINSTENRAAWHTALRSGENSEVKTVLQKMRRLATQLRSERKFKRIVNLGTGGSDLGPRLLADALANGKEAGTLDVRFAANADPRDLERALEGAKPDETLFVVASKTFTTQETMANAAAAKHWLGSRDISKHFIAVTAETGLAKSFGVREILPMWDWVGGRFSVWSAVGFAAMCAIGADSFEDFLKGGNEIDRHFAEAPLEIGRASC